MFLTPKDTNPQYLEFHRGERGLTTLEWLLIVAAIAGLAALAVVLVQTVVNETAEGSGYHFRNRLGLSGGERN